MTISKEISNFNVGEQSKSTTTFSVSMYEYGAMHTRDHNYLHYGTCRSEFGCSSF